MEDRQVPWIAHEATLAAMERTIRRMWILTLVLAVLLVGSNAAWLYYESQWQTEVTTEVTQHTDRGGFNNYIGNNGDINNGDTDCKDDAQAR